MRDGYIEFGQLAPRAHDAHCAILLRDCLAVVSHRICAHDLRYDAAGAVCCENDLLHWDGAAVSELSAEVGDGVKG